MVLNVTHRIVAKFLTISVEEVLSIIHNLENKNSSGYDDISNKYIKSINPNDSSLIMSECFCSF